MPTVSAFVKENVAKGSTVKTDGLRSYWSLPHQGFTHEQESLTNDPAKAEAHLPMIHALAHAYPVCCQLGKYLQPWENLTRG